MSIDTYTAAIVPGSGLVHRDHGVVLLVPDAGGQAGSAVTASLLDVFAQPLDPTGRRTVRAVAALLTRTDPADVPPFAAALDTDRGLVVLVHSGTEVVVHADEPARLRGSDSLAWVERLFAGPVQSVDLGTATAAGHATGSAQVPLDLIRGTVPGAAVHLHAGMTSEPAPMTILPRSVQAQVVTGGITAPRTAAAGSARMAGAPEMVEGVLCSRGHFNDPDAAYCSICGIAMQQRSRELVSQPRPPLGVMILDDGSAFSLDTGYVVGRDPGEHPAVQAGDARPLALNDDVNGVSRIHARLALAGWSVCVTDEGSANGTYLADATGACAVRNGNPMTLSNGAVLRIGRRTMTFHSYHSEGE